MAPRIPPPWMIAEIRDPAWQEIQVPLYAPPPIPPTEVRDPRVHERIEEGPR